MSDVVLFRRAIGESLSNSRYIRVSHIRVSLILVSPAKVFVGPNRFYLFVFFLARREVERRKRLIARYALNGGVFVM